MNTTNNALRGEKKEEMKGIQEKVTHSKRWAGNVSRAPPTCLALVHPDFNSNPSSFCKMQSLPPWRSPRPASLANVRLRARGGPTGWWPRSRPLPGETVQSLDEVICPWAVLLGALHQWHRGKDNITGQELMLEAKMNAESLYAHVLHPATRGGNVIVPLRVCRSVLKLWVSSRC